MRQEGRRRWVVVDCLPPPSPLAVVASTLSLASHTNRQACIVVHGVLRFLPLTLPRTHICVYTVLVTLLFATSTTTNS